MAQAKDDIVKPFYRYEQAIEGGGIQATVTRQLLKRRAVGTVGLAELS